MRTCPVIPLRLGKMNEVIQPCMSHKKRQALPCDHHHTSMQAYGALVLLVLQAV
jgi:hypothetical protein